MEKITINKHNTEKAYAAFQTGKIAVATDGKHHGIIKYDDLARTGTNREHKWSICAFGNMLISLLNGQFKEIYITNPLDKNIFNTYEEMMQAVREKTTHVIVKEEF